MNKRATLIQGGLAAVGLMAAYATWQRSPELEAGEAFVIDGTKTDVGAIRFEDSEAKSWSELTPGHDDNGAFVWLRISGFDNTGTQLPSGHPSVLSKRPERLVRGNEAAEHAYERFAPLRATRALGKLDDKTEKELGLDKSKKRIVVTVRGVKRAFAIAAPPAGGTDPYLQAEDSGQVYVVPRTTLTDIEAAATNLTERRMHAFNLQAFDKVVVTAGGKSKEFTARRREGRPDIDLIAAGAADKPDISSTNWHDRIFKVFPDEILGQGETPDVGAPAVRLRLDYSSRGRPVGFMEIGGTSVLYARTELTAGWDRLRGDAVALLTEGEGLVQPAPAATPGSIAAPKH